MAWGHIRPARKVQKVPHHTLPVMKRAPTLHAMLSAFGVTMTSRNTFTKQGPRIAFPMLKFCSLYCATELFVLPGWLLIVVCAWLSALSVCSPPRRQRDMTFPIE